MGKLVIRQKLWSGSGSNFCQNQSHQEPHVAVVVAVHNLQFQMAKTRQQVTTMTTRKRRKKDQKIVMCMLQLTSFRDNYIQTI